MKKKLSFRDILMILVLIMLAINAIQTMSAKKAGAETFRLDDCITTKPGDKPAAYLHVVSHE